MLAVHLALASVTLLVLATWLSLRRVRMRVSLHASGTWDEDARAAWTIAGGAELGALQVSGARLHGRPGAWQAHLFGRSVVRSRGSGDAKATTSRARARRRSASRWLRRVDPIVAIELALDAFVHVRVEALSARVRCAAVDPLLAARVAGALAVLSGALAPVAKIDSAIDWAADEDALDVDGHLEASFLPLVLAYDLARFVAQHVFARLLRFQRRLRLPRAEARARAHVV